MNLEGSRLGRFELHAEIGRGGMGVVYSGHDPDLDRPVAVKLLAPHLVWEKEFVARFLREARAAARLKHPHIVIIHDVGEQDDHYYFVMEHLDGRPLNQVLLDEGRLPSDQALDLLRQLADALDYAHEQGLVHRDVKPANVMVDEQDHATLTDFGVVRAAQETPLTFSGATVGTPRYMSPEQGLGLGVGPPADLYSLAVIAYEMLSGEPPFDADSTPALLHMHVYEPPPPIISKNPELSPAVDKVFDRALAKDPAQRYATGAAFVAALDQALSGEADALAPSLLATALSDEGGTPMIALVPAAQPGARDGRPRLPKWIWGLGAVPVLALVAGVLFILLGSGDEGETGLVPSVTPRPTQVMALEPTATADAASALTAIETETATPTLAPTDLPSATPSGTPMHTPTATPSRTPTPETPTPTPTPTLSPTPMTFIEVEVAAGKPATASDYWQHPTDPNWAFPPENVVDRETVEDNCKAGEHSYWLLPDFEAGWVQIDLQGEFPITRLRWLNTFNGPCADRATTKHHIGLSRTRDFVDEVEVCLGTEAFSKSPLYQGCVLSTPVLARYVRFYVEEYHDRGGGLNELEVYAEIPE